MAEIIQVLVTETLQVLQTLAEPTATVVFRESAWVNRPLHTIGAGLTLSGDGVLSNDLVVGKAGGQTVVGGTGSDDAITYKGTSGAGTLASIAHKFVVGNDGDKTAAVITNAGYVGYGTLVPLAPIHVYRHPSDGAVQFVADSGTRALDIWAGDNNVTLDFSSEGGLRIRAKAYANRGGNSGATFLAALTGVGKLGIGTSSPIARAHFTETGTAVSTGTDMLVLGAPISSVVIGSGPAIVFVNQSTNVKMARIRAYAMGASISGLTLETGHSSPVPRILIDNDGDVGVGTTSPLARLHITGAGVADGNGTNVVIVGGPISASTIGSGPAILFENQSTNVALARIRAYSLGASVTGLVFETGHSSPLPRLFIDNSGNVGVGALPTALFDVAGAFRVGSAVEDSLGGYVRTFAEATTGTMSGASATIAVNIPVGARALGVQLRVDTTITSGAATSWSASFAGGLSQSLVTGQSLSVNTKALAMVDPNYASAIVAGSVATIVITPNSGTFTGGVVRAIAYYETWSIMGNA
jgi:hypothetical protein